MGDDIRSLDAPWTAEKVAILLDGEVLVTITDENGEMHEVLAEGASAYELAMRAIDGGDPTLIIEVAQLRKSITHIRDQEVRAMLNLKVTTGESEWLIADALRALGLRSTQRSPIRLVERGIDLIRRIERGKHSELRRVRAALGRSDTPVCWRCLESAVDRVGDDCGTECPALAPDKWDKGAGAAKRHDYTNRPKPSKMTAEERAAELAELVRTQNEGPIPGDAYYRKKVVPYGLQREPGTRWDVRRSDA